MEFNILVIHRNHLQIIFAKIIRDVETGGPEGP